ncbi:hypothetical protein ACFL9T_18015 [Thermodesulfobacteriota bacterium]
MGKSRFIILAAILVPLFLFGCSGPKPPLNEIRTALKDTSTYSLVLDDMRKEGTFFKDYYHKYRVITEEDTREIDWMEVPEDYFNRYLPYLGMTIWSKKDGKETSAIGPAGYEYIGDPKYGSWQRGSTGGSFWVFYGQYMFMSHMLGRGPLYRNSYASYRDHRAKNRPYFGSKKQYGTEGYVTKRQKPNFYQRATYKNMAKKASFSDRVNKRVGRSRSSLRGRSGRGGK